MRADHKSTISLDDHRPKRTGPVSSNFPISMRARYRGWSRLPRTKKQLDFNGSLTGKPFHGFRGNSNRSKSPRAIALVRLERKGVARSADGRRSC